MANSNNGRIFDEIVRAVAVEYGWDAQPESIVRAPLAPGELARLAGRFTTDRQQPFTITVVGTRVEMRRPFSEPTELVPVDAHTLVEVEQGLRLTVDEGAQRLTLSVPRGGVLQASRLADDARLPILELEAGHYDVALAGYRELLRATPASPAVDEQFLNMLGIEQMWRKAYDKSIAVLRVNVALYPDSMNTYDSLAEAYARAGERQQAIATFEAGLAAMARDQKSPASFKQLLQKRAARRIAELSAK
jgi:tetratricopeptide (TPR) repeat protein